jgi:hypothetical protein
MPRDKERNKIDDLDNPHVHHDAFEFPGGAIVMLTHLFAGQKATVLQLPARPLKESETRAEKVAAYVVKINNPTVWDRSMARSRRRWCSGFAAAADGSKRLDVKV